MKIKGFTCYPARPRWLFLKLDTDEGVSGWGEPIIEGRTHTVQAAVEELSYYFMQKDPMAIEDLWQTFYRGGFYRGGPEMMSAIAGIDQALWDIKGKVLNIPIYQLLGGACRERLRVYCWIGGDRPADVAAEALKKRAEGYTAVKMNATGEMHYIDSYAKVEDVLKRADAIRSAVGNEMEFGIDFHGRVHKSMAKVLGKELEPYHPMFIEEPVLAENIEALREVARYTSIPIATGERMFSRWDFKRLLTSGYVDIIQPDLSHAGGISECRKIATMAEAFDVAVAPHCPLGPIALAACVQMDMCTPNVFIQEQSLGIHYNQGSDLLDYLKDTTPFAYHDGFILPPTKPGLGIDLDEEKIVSMALDAPQWKNPVWRNQDGTIAEW